MNQRLQRIREFIQYDLWRQSDVAIHDPKKRLWYRTLQTIILVARGFKDKALNVRANSLSFSLLFAFVPLIAGVLPLLEDLDLRNCSENSYLRVSSQKQTLRL